MWQSPHFARPRAEMRPRGVTTAGQKKGIFGQVRAKAGQHAAAKRSRRPFLPYFLGKQNVRADALRVRAGTIDVMSLSGMDSRGTASIGAADRAFTIS